MIKPHQVKVLALVPYPLEGSSSRYRIYQFVEPMLQHNIAFTVHAIMTNSVYKNKMSGQKLGLSDYFSLFYQIILRFYLIMTKKFDIIIISREFMPILRRQMHWFFSKIVRIPVVYDFDDAVFVQFPIDNLLICAVAATPGNQFLSNYVKKINPKCKIQIIPTVVDTYYYKPQMKNRFLNPLVVGWIGTESTYNRYLALKLDFLVEIAQRYQAVVHVIGPNIIREDVTSKGAIFLEWSLLTERDHMAGFHVGVMPLVDDSYTKGKCAFKIIEYGAFGIPSVASDVGANHEVVIQDKTGFLVNSDFEWEHSLSKLLTDSELRLKMGSLARDHIKSKYSLDSQISVWVNLIQEVIESNQAEKSKGFNSAK
jgi:glycosyltransferase involved in cell wall biosynthesis